MDRLVRAFPLLEGKRDAFRAFTHEMSRRRAEADVFYRSFGIVRESWHLQETAGGELIICCTDIEDVRTGSAYAASQGQFETWFKGRVLDICGIDPNIQPLGPECRTVFEWPASS